MILSLVDPLKYAQKGKKAKVNSIDANSDKKEKSIDIELKFQ